MGGKGDRVPRYLVSWNNRVKNNKRLILQDAYIESRQVVSFITRVSSKWPYGLG
jgi:hypothetical protein